MSDLIISVRIPESVGESLKKIAAKAEHSVHQTINKALREWVSAHQSQKGK